MKGCFGAVICFILGTLIVAVAFLLGRASRSPEAEKTGRVTIEDLKRELKDAEENVRKMAAEALGDKGEDAASAVPDLIEGLKDKSEAVRRAAAEALEKIGPKAREALPALKEQLSDGADAVRDAAKKAIEKIQSSDGKPVKPPIEPEGPDADHEEKESEDDF